MQHFFLLFSLQKNGKKGGDKMPSTKPGRELIHNYLESQNIKVVDLAKMYGITKQDAFDYISGRKVTPAANRFIISVIRDFKIT